MLDIIFSREDTVYSIAFFIMVDFGKLFQIQKNAPAAPPPAPKPVAKKIVLIVEDESDIANIYQQILAEAGYDAIIAVNGEDGLKKIVEHDPSLIILDIRMPVMDGKTMLSELKNDPKYAQFKFTPVIMLSNSGNTDNIRDTQRLGGAEEFIIKANIEPNEIVNIAKKYIA